ncbi:CoA-binding protein [Maribacter hydrothermalis]|uniref:CoA-binding protein n=1 Tax=Maribacter hydrothermalis TaxID=1836467 RepID=A0A1B7Z735_9FLAO|nr:CoA-binding protein [Maribacter hydrothermalis]APQ16392.1 CoA-binding protein [Maribacter hydrothermalis]OBR38494.1 CoA-binding protein [Maribacter hydrothermalis]
MKKTLVFGASLKPNRYSNLVIRRLVDSGIETFAYGLGEGEVSGVKISNRLSKINDIHTITLYLNPKRQEEYYDKIISLAPSRVIFNPGTENPTFYSMLEKNGIEVEVACTLVLLTIGQF